jgi:hypothetical protein
MGVVAYVWPHLLVHRHGNSLPWQFLRLTNSNIWIRREVPGVVICPCSWVVSYTPLRTLNNYVSQLQGVAGVAHCQAICITPESSQFAFQLNTIIPCIRLLQTTWISSICITAEPSHSMYPSFAFHVNLLNLRYSWTFSVHVSVFCITPESSQFALQLNLLNPCIRLLHYTWIFSICTTAEPSQSMYPSGWHSQTSSR